MLWQQEMVMCAVTVHIEPEQTDYGILMCFTLINSSSHQKIYIFASLFFLLHMRLCLVSGTGNLIWSLDLALWEFLSHVVTALLLQGSALEQEISGGKNKQTIFQLKTTIFQSMANIWKHGSCLILYGVRPEAANSTHPKLLVFKQEKKINRKAVVWDFGACLRVFLMLTRRRKWHTLSASEGRVIGTF